MMELLKEKITTACQIHGLILQRNAIKKILDYMSELPDSAHQIVLDKIIEQLQQQQHLDIPTISEHSIQEAIETLQSINEGSYSEKIFTVIDAFAIPKFVLDGERKKYVKSSESSCLFGVASMKSDLYINRYNVIHRRLLRHSLFKQSVAGESVNSKKYVLKPVEYLLGSSTSPEIGNIVVFGMLTQLKEGKYYLEDPTGTAELDLSNTISFIFLQNLTLGCFVLAEGFYEDRVFHVKGLGLPPTEPSRLSREYLGNVNFFGGNLVNSVKSSNRLREIEEENPNSSFVFIADVWLDDIKVVNKLRRLFEGFSLFPPTCFVFIGNFHSAALKMSRPALFESMKQSFQKLSEILLEFRSLINTSKFVFVPGPQDPEASEIIPRPPIPKVISQEFCNRIPGAVFTTNPCRLQFCTKEIVVFREDLVTKMCRNCITVPAKDPIPTHFAKTILSQFCLSSLPLHILPVYWNCEHAMSLFPLPDLIVCADKYHPFTEENADCLIINPGSFSMSNFVFKVYLPCKDIVEDSHIPDD
ncbi:DNA polymerase epsilon subunit 2 [Chamberlinius hualienensis]